MKKNIEPMKPNAFYHVYNRGINGENLFKEERNYSYFLKKYAFFIENVAETYSYCLLKNHFHFLIRTRSEEEIRKGVLEKIDPYQVEASLKKEKLFNKPIPSIISNAFGSLFKSYAQSINLAHKRTGRLFEEPFRRILVDSDEYFTEMISYIHRNPQKHGFVNDFRDYPYSSYHSILKSSATLLKKQEVLDWFGDKKEFEKFHLKNEVQVNLNKFDIEFD